MLDDNVLDFYHLRKYVTEATHALFGQGSQEAVSWKTKMMETVKTQASLAMLDRLGEYLTSKPDDSGQTELQELRDCLAKRLEGAGMRWDKDNAEAAMALASLYSSHLWNKYWDINNMAA